MVGSDKERDSHRNQLNVSAFSVLQHEPYGSPTESPSKDCFQLTGKTQVRVVLMDLFSLP